MAKKPGNQTYKVAEAARLAGVSASTLRLWESQGLVVPQRSTAGHRRYSAKAVTELQRIVWLRTERGLNPAAIRQAMEGKSASRKKTRADPASEIGKRLRVLRHAAGKTLQTVSDDVGVAVSKLSTLERTSKGVSISVLRELAEYYGTTISRLSGQEPTRKRILIRADERPAWPVTSPGVLIQLLAEGQNAMDCHCFVLAPGASSDGAYKHEGEEFIFVLYGGIEVVLDDSEFYDLQPGDALYFESRRQHAWRNSCDGETALLWINTPPSF